MINKELITQQKCNVSAKNKNNEKAWSYKVTTEEMGKNGTLIRNCAHA